MKRKKFLSILLTVAMVICAVPASIFAALSYDDTQNHWAEEAIDRWSEYEVVQGKGDGRFDPDGQMTRAEAAQVFANLLGLNKTADVSKFKDVKNTWYKDAISKCYAAGILNGKGEGKMDPNGKITREEFITMYARAICISNGTTETEAKKELKEKGYTDTNKVSNWAVDAVKTLVDKGFVKGVSQTELAPKNNIDRASVMALLNQSVTTYVGKNSTETTVAAKSEGITLIANPNVTKVTGNADVVVVAAGAEKYDETTGEIEHSDIKVESAKMPIARVEGENITVTLTINTEADDAEVTVTGVGSEIIVESTASVKNVTLSAEGSKATVAGKVETIKVEETAKEAVVDTKSTAKVETVENKAENTTVKGTGTVTEVKSSEDVKIETKNTKVENTNETKQIAVTDSKGSETKVETKTESSSTGTTSETTVNKEEEKPSGGGGYVPPAHTHDYGDGTKKCSCGNFADDIVAAIGNQGYKTLAEAVSEAAISATITLLKDIDQPTNNVFLSFKENVTFDLNSKTIYSGAIYTSDAADLSDGQAYVFQGENFTVKNGTLAGVKGSDKTANYAYGAYIGFCTTGAITTSAVTLENVTMPSGGVNVADAKDVTVKNCTVTAAGAYYAVCVQTDSGEEPSVTIDGGTYTAGTNNNVVWVSSGAAMTIKAGTFIGDCLVDANGTLSIIGGTFDHNPTEYLHVDYKADEQGKDPETWVVCPRGEICVASNANLDLRIYMSLAEFRDSVNNGNTYKDYTVTVLKDLDYSGTPWVSIGKVHYNYNNYVGFSGNFDGNNKTIKVSNTNIVPTTDYEYFGFFTLIRNSDSTPIEIKDLTLDVDFASNNQYLALGGLTSELWGNIIVKNVKVIGSLDSARTVGGLVCNANYASSYEEIAHITNCVVQANVSAHSVRTSDNWLGIGGIVFQSAIRGGLYIENCTFSGILEANYDEGHKAGAQPYMGYAMAKSGNESRLEKTIISGFIIGQNSSIIGYQENPTVNEHGIPFEGLNKYDSSYTYQTEANVNKELVGGYHGVVIIDEAEYGTSGTGFPHGGSQE